MPLPPATWHFPIAIIYVNVKAMNSKISSYFFFVLLLSAVVAAIIIFLPFLTPLILGVAASVIVYPLYLGISRIFGKGRIKENLAALATVFIVLIVILVPLFLLLSQMYAEIQILYAFMTDEGGRSVMINNLNHLFQVVSKMLFNVFPAYNFDSLNITTYIKDILVWAFGNLDKIFTGIVRIVAYTFVFMLSMYYFLRDGAMIKRRFISWSPLLDTHDEFITKTLKRAVLSVFGGTIVVAVVQGILTGLGFFVFGIPAPVIWGSMASIAAFIPGVGTSLIIIPGIIYLIIIGNYTYAIGLALWGMLAVGLVDNILGPYLVNKGVNIHPFLILISVLGGISTFGPIGFVLGPLILATLFALLEIYRTSFTSIEKGE